MASLLAAGFMAIRLEIPSSNLSPTCRQVQTLETPTSCCGPSEGFDLTGTDQGATPKVPALSQVQVQYQYEYKQNSLGIFYPSDKFLDALKLYKKNIKLVTSRL